MESHARAVVIGGGCVGAGILYGLTKRGWTDVVMLERTQLTAGSTWHAAGLIPSYARSRSIGMMIQKSIEIYEGLEAETGLKVGWHKCGQLRIAKSRDRLDEFKSYLDTHETQGIRASLLDKKAVHELWPLLRADEEMLGALYNPDDGHIAPADVTMAMAKGARDRGARIYQQTEVKSVARTVSGEWEIITNRGTIICEHVISATGNYARQTGAMFGLDLPAIPILHQYWITEAVPAVKARKAAGLPEMPILRDEAYEGYIREEGDGLMFGPYERTEKLHLFAENGVPDWFGADLVEEDFDAVAWNWELAMQTVPALGEVGIKANVRGPFQMTPDELPLMGKPWGVPNLWLAEGVPGGILWGAAIGHYLSEQIVEGGNSLDTSALDPRRFGDYANKNWLKPKIIESWGTHGMQHYPGEDREAARPQKTAPSYDFLDRKGAVWGVLNGWEHPNWFAPEGMKRENQYSWRWTEKGVHVGDEVRAVREAAGLVEMTFMAKYEVSGTGAAAWLDSILANRLPKVGRANLSHLLTPRGTVVAEFTVSRLAEDCFYLIGTPSAERLYFDELARLLPPEGVSLRNVSNERAGMTVVGPKARDILQGLTETSLANADFPWFAVKSVNLGLASDVRMLRINYSGELGWEIYCPMQYQRSLIAQIFAAGEPHGLKPVGTQALESLRLEKSYRAMYRDMNGELTAWESSLDRFIALDKGDFIGRAALLIGKPAQRSVTVKIPTDGASLIGGESLYRDGKLAGRILSGSYSYTFGHDIGIALLPADIRPGDSFALTLLGKPHQASVIEESPYDPQSLRARG